MHDSGRLANVFGGAALAAAGGRTVDQAWRRFRPC
jgi:hypothetical protein